MAFSLTGQDLTTNQSIIFVGDEEAILGVLPGASSPTFSGDSLLFTEGAQKRSVKTADLLGANLRGIYSLPQTSASTPEYIQIFADGRAMADVPRRQHSQR